MAIKTIPLSRLETDLEKTLNECAASGETVVVEMKDHRLFAIQSLDPGEDDGLTFDMAWFHREGVQNLPAQFI